MNSERIKNIIDAVTFAMILSIFTLFYLTRPVSVPKNIYVPKGSINYIIQSLQSGGYDLLPLDKVFISLLGHPQSGWIDLKTEKPLSKLDFLYRLTTSKAVLKKITIIPGETNYFILDQIADKLKIDEDVLIKECDSIKEGFFYPNTFNLPMGMPPKDVCLYLSQKSLHYHKDISTKIFKNYIPEKYYRYLIIASIIQKESATVEEMPLVSSVIYNRLKKKMRLQMDGTLNYGKYSHTKVTPERIKEDQTRYNTYKYRGLPKKAVCNPSLEAVKAAIFPTKSNYLYFVKVWEEHIFTHSYKEHLKNVKKRNTFLKQKKKSE